MHANKGNRKPQTSSQSVTKTNTKPSGDESDQNLDNGKGSAKKTGKTRKEGGSSHRSSIHMKRVLSGKISRRSLNGFISKSVRNSSQHRLGHRPRRNVIHRTWDYTAGLSWKEEKELKKALMASLQESKRTNKPAAEPNGESSNGNREVMQSKADRKQKMLKLQIPQPREAGNQTETSAKSSNVNYHVQVRAQRKFAQGSRPCSPGCSPLKARSLHGKALVTKKAKTEDFLTFLCLRGTTTLPPHLDFSNNFMECDSLSSFPNTPRHSQDGSRPETPITTSSNHGNNGRGTDDTSRSGSPDVEITLESAELGVKPLPVETPESSPVKSDPVIQVEPDTTVVDEKSADLSHDVIILKSVGENAAEKNEPKRQMSPTKLKQNKSKSPDKSVLKRKMSKSDAHGSPANGTSPTKKSPKKPCAKETQRSLRYGPKKSEEMADLVDLTEAEGQAKKSLLRKTRGKTEQRTTNKRSVSPTDDSDAEQRSSVSPRRRLRTDSLTRHCGKTKESPERHRLGSRRAHASGSQDDLLESTASKKSHLRSSSQQNPSSKAMNDNRPSDFKKEVDSDMMTRSKTGTIPKAAIPAGFPNPTDPARCVEVPTYHPSTEQFQDPIAYLDSIWRDAEPYGMCRIVPPDGWKPECDISEELRFTTQVQYIHKMADRWGISVKQFECIKQHLKSQGINMEQSPCVGGVELDLPSVSAAIRSQGGLQSVINKNKWLKVAENMKIPKAGQERISRLYEIYCKYLLSYDTLSQEEKERLEQEVENKYMKGSRHLDQSCTSKGRSKPLSEFFRVARNTQSMWFNDDEPMADQVEDLYWQLVNERNQHVSIQVAHIDTKHCGSAFPAKKDSPYARHGWNYNILQHHPSSVLRHLGQVTGLTVPMLHIGMVFSTSCWARDPHFLPYMVYSHTGADVIWYCVPTSEEAKFKQALEDVAPKLIDAQSPIWLPEDSVMIDPQILLEHGVSYCRTVQYQGEFVVVFPKAFTATVTCGYNISESLHFATAKWLPLGYEAAQLLYASGEPDLFSMEKLLYLLATDDKTPTESLQILLPLLEKSVEEELHLRKRLGEAGLQQAKKVSRNEAFLTGQDRPRRSVDLTSHEENRCDSSCKICYFSTVVNEAENMMFALQDALLHIKRKKNLRNCKLLYRFDQKELKDLIQQVKTKVTCGRSSGKRKNSKSR